MGIRLESEFQLRGVSWQPYLRANLLHTFGGTDQTVFAGSTAIGTTLSSTAAQFGAGVAAKTGKNSSLYATVSYTTHLDGTSHNAIFGNLGVRWNW